MKPKVICLTDDSCSDLKKKNPRDVVWMQNIGL